MTTIDDARDLFPVLQNSTYLNTAWRGPLAKPIQAAVEHYMSDLASRGVAAWDDWHAEFDTTRALFADFVGADSDEVIFLANATEALSRVTLGLDWNAGDNVVVVRGDYSGVTRPMSELARQGVSVNWVEPNHDATVSVQSILDRVDANTRMVAVSHVDFRSGHRIDIEALGQKLRERGVLFLVDCVQSVGALPIDLHAVDCDFATFASRKWLNGLDTLGLLYVRRGSLDTLTPHTRGVYSVAEPFDFDTIDQPHAEGCQRFMLGAPAMPQIYALHAALKLHLEIGVLAIHAQVAALRDHAVGEARELGYSVLAAESGAGITSLRVPDPDAVVERLSAQNIMASVRGDVLRLSAHYYNSESEIDRALSAIHGP